MAFYFTLMSWKTTYQHSLNQNRLIFMKIKRCFNNKKFSLALALAGTFEIKAKVLISNRP